MLDLFSFHMRGEEGEGTTTFHTSQESSKTFLERKFVAQSFQCRDKWIITIIRREREKENDILWVERSIFQL